MEIDEPYNDLLSSGETAILDSTEKIVQSMLKAKPHEIPYLHRSKEGYFTFVNAIVYNKQMNVNHMKKLDRM